MDLSKNKAPVLAIFPNLKFQGGFTFHKRLLVLNNAVLAYYSKVPTEAYSNNSFFLFFSLFHSKSLILIDDGFDINKLLKLNMKPKAQLPVEHIQDILKADEVFLKKKKKKFVFIVVFHKSALVGGGSEIYDNAKDQAKWVFAVAQAADFEKWLNLLELSRRPPSTKLPDTSLMDDDTRRSVKRIIIAKLIMLVA